MFKLILLLGAISLAACDPVHIISYNLEQTVTSSTLQWVSTDGRDTSILKYAVIAAYQTTSKPLDSIMTLYSMRLLQIQMSRRLPERTTTSLNTRNPCTFAGQE